MSLQNYTNNFRVDLVKLLSSKFFPKLGTLQISSGPLCSPTTPTATFSPMAAGARPFVSLLFFLLFLLFRVTTSDDANILLKFKANVTDPAGSLRGWGQNSNPCAKPVWQGVLCGKDGAVRGLQLENMSLSGRLYLDPLTALPQIRSLSFTNNSFTGPMPDVRKFKGLKNVYFSMNNLTGEIPDDAFDGMQSLKKAFLSRNGFTGQIPSSLARVDSLLELWVDYNGFVGEIPSFGETQAALGVANFSNNKLEGKIPDRLSKMDPSMFADNKALCGPPLTVQCPSPPASPPKKLSTTLIAALAVVCVGVVVAIIGATYAILRRRKLKEEKEMSGASQFQKPKRAKSFNGEQGGGGATHKKAAAPAADREQGRLEFIREEERETFALQDLLRASAEVLGSGEFGSSYKALLPNGPAVVVKRFREMNRMGKDDFQEHMRRIGRLSHPNLLPLVAYYYRKEEKLLITDFIPYGSLARLLHGNRTADNPALDWPTRLKIVKGIARGLSYLYDELSVLSTPHGHLKSSNVLLTETYEPLLTDYALIPVMNQAHASQVMIAHKSPEYKHHGKLSKKSDVWSLGVLVLEILTGKFPGNYSRRARGAGPDLPNWVNSVVREEWTGEVFDGEMKRTRGGEGEMLNLLQIGLGCCEVDVNKRWELRYAVEKIEELKEREGGDDDGYSSFVSEGEGYNSSKGGVTEDDFSFSTNNP